MIEKLTAKPGVIALRVSAHLARADIDQCFELLAENFERHDRTDLYFEVVGLTGADTGAFTADLQRASGLFEKRGRFDRIAIVSDESWIRWTSRIESALLPGISYRTYKLGEREQALDWVQHRADLPYGHALKIIPTTRADAIGIEIDGRLSVEEVSQVAAELNKGRNGPGLKAVLVRFRSIRGFDPGIMADSEYLRMKLGLIGELERYAVVGGPAWLATWFKLWRPLLRIELRHFDTKDKGVAWTWVGAQPLAERPLAA